MLPYGGTYRGHDGALAHALGFLAAWSPYQGPDEVKLDPQFWGDGAGTVCVLFRHRAVDPRRGVRLDAPEVSIYQVRDGRVAHPRCFMPTPPPWPSSSPMLRQRQQRGSAEASTAPAMGRGPTTTTLRTVRSVLGVSKPLAHRRWPIRLQCLALRTLKEVTVKVGLVAVHYPGTSGPICSPACSMPSKRSAPHWAAWARTAGGRRPATRQCQPGNGSRGQR